jgi:hypothetical protein
MSLSSGSSDIDPDRERVISSSPDKPPSHMQRSLLLAHQLDNQSDSNSSGTPSTDSLLDESPVNAVNALQRKPTAQEEHEHQKQKQQHHQGQEKQSPQAQAPTISTPPVSSTSPDSASTLAPSNDLADSSKTVTMEPEREESAPEVSGTTATAAVAVVQSTIKTDAVREADDAVTTVSYPPTLESLSSSANTTSESLDLATDLSTSTLVHNPNNVEVSSTAPTEVRRLVGSSSFRELESVITKKVRNDSMSKRETFRAIVSGGAHSSFHLLKSSIHFFFFFGRMSMLH